MNTFRINFFTYGDARDINTWSNVPYFFHRALLARDVLVNPIDLTPSDSRAFGLFCHWRNVRARLASFIGRPTSPDVFRTRFNYALTNARARSGSRQYAGAALNVFLTYSFSSHRYSRTPVVLYCDRTYEHYLEECARIPTPRDRAFIAVERENLAHADLVLAMSELCRDFIDTHYTTRRLAYLGAGINADSSDIDARLLVARKERHHDILFVGRGAHKRGVDILLKAFMIFNQRQGGRFVLRVVGIRPEELAPELQAARGDVHFYGYLDRSVSRERDQYNALIQSARLFVFPTRPGPVAGVLREAKLNCTPIIISRVPGAAERVTHDYDGVLVDSFEPEDFARQMELLVMDMPRWRRLAYNAHASVEDSTWSSTARDFLVLVERNGLVPGEARQADS
jgi:glycosyltransferase involved in cell wall biosynthesis